MECVWKTARGRGFRCALSVVAESRPQEPLGRSPGSEGANRTELIRRSLHLPRLLTEWRDRSDAPSLTVAGPRRICTGLPCYAPRGHPRRSQDPSTQPVQLGNGFHADGHMGSGMRCAGPLAGSHYFIVLRRTMLAISRGCRLHQKPRTDRQPSTAFTLLGARSSKGSEELDRTARLTMRTFDVQGIEIMVPRHKVFEFLRVPGNLPRWAHAFVSAGDGRARLETPAGAVDIALDVSTDAETGTVDWRLVFPDGGVGIAQSRVTFSAVRLSQQAEDVGLPNRRQLHPRHEEESGRAHALELRPILRRPCRGPLV